MRLESVIHCFAEPFGAFGRVIRAMVADGSKAPLCGSTTNRLGVRPGVDIKADNGNVAPACGGLSVAPNDARLLPLHLRPTRLGGKGRLPVFQLEVAYLGCSLSYRPDPRSPQRHGFVEPCATMLMCEYQDALAATKDDWKLLS